MKFIMLQYGNSFSFSIYESMYVHIRPLENFTFVLHEKWFNGHTVVRLAKEHARTLYDPKGIIWNFSLCKFCLFHSHLQACYTVEEQVKGGHFNSFNFSLNLQEITLSSRRKFLMLYLLFIQVWRYVNMYIHTHTHKM